jgi:hypothetical protein
VYNTLPNVVVLFTMTLALRHRLHGLMERQFRDRIRMDDKFLLRAPERDQVLDVYRSRVGCWVRDDPALADRYRRLANPYLPFDRDGVLAVVGAPQSLRDVLAALDAAFHRAIAELPIGPQLDYQYDLRELRPLEAAQTEWDYTAGHLGTVSALLRAAGDVLAPNCRVAAVEEDEVDGTPYLRLRLECPTGPGWVTVYLARLGHFFSNHSAKLIDGLLAHRQKSRHFLWLVRAKPFEPEVPPHYQTQVFARLAPPEAESMFRALGQVAARRATAGPEYGPPADALLRDQVARTYLGELLQDAGRRLAAGAGVEPAAEPAPVSP